MHRPVLLPKLILALFLFLSVAGCAATQPQPAAPSPQPLTATSAPTAVPPTAVPAAATPLPDPTVEPTPSITEMPTAIPPTATPECTGPLTPTAANAEGPYYMPNAPLRATLYEEGMPGTRLVVTGRVLAADCAPVAGAVLDFWQADANGDYDNVGYTLRGKQETAADGSYRLETVLPGEYPGRPPHIHVKVNAPGRPVLTTQIYFAGQPGNESDNLIQPSLITTLATDPDGSLSATFDFVLEP